MRGSSVFIETENVKPVSDFVYIDIDAIDNKHHVIHSPKKILHSDIPSRARRKILRGDVLFSLVRPYLENIAFVSSEFENAIASTGFFVVRSNKYISNLYTFFLFLSPYVIQGLNEYMKGDNSPSIKSENIYNYLFPIPPFQEQQRIVEKVEEILSHVEECKKAHERYTSILSKSPGNLREQLIQAAIQGQLVPQDENDEPAAVLLERIAKERAAKMGKKTAKSMSRIERRGRETYEIFPTGSEKDITKEIPFDIPDSWKWCRLDFFCEYGGVPSVKVSDCASDNWVLDLEDIAPHSGCISQRISAKERASKSNKYSFKKGMVLYSKLRPYLNKVIVAEEAGCCTTEIIPISVFANSNPYYFQKFLMSPYFVGEINNDAYGIKMPRADTQKIKAFLVPVPPLQEQRRIVERLESLMACIPL